MIMKVVCMINMIITITFTISKTLTLRVRRIIEINKSIIANNS